jgi:hypothetical protein
MNFIMIFVVIPARFFIRGRRSTLIVTDLRSAPLALLERCMGRPAARSFLERQNLALRDPRIARFLGAARHTPSQ